MNLAEGHEDVIVPLGFRGFTGFRGRFVPPFVITDNDAGAAASEGCVVQVKGPVACVTHGSFLGVCSLPNPWIPGLSRA